jgi:hypothetical protein
MTAPTTTIKVQGKTHTVSMTFEECAHELSDMLDGDRGIELLRFMLDEYKEADHDRFNLGEQVTELQSTKETHEIKLDDIMLTFDMVTTGYRDFTDLARTIQA